MPKIKLSDEEKRLREFRGIVARNRIRHGIATNDILAARLDISIANLYNRLRDPGSFRLEEFKRLVWILKLSDEEVLQIIKE